MKGYIVTEETKDDTHKIISINHKTLADAVKFVKFNTGRVESTRKLSIYKLITWSEKYTEVDETKEVEDKWN